MSAQPEGSPIVEEVVEAILVYFSTMEAPINFEDLVDRNHTPYVVKVRAVVMYYLKTVLGMSYMAIGRLLQRDHSSVLSLIRTIRDKFSEEELAEVAEYVEARMIRVRADRKAALLAAVK